MEIKNTWDNNLLITLKIFCLMLAVTASSGCVAWIPYLLSSSNGNVEFVETRDKYRMVFDGEVRHFVTVELKRPKSAFVQGRYGAMVPLCDEGNDEALDTRCWPTGENRPSQELLDRIYFDSPGHFDERILLLKARGLAPSYGAGRAAWILRADPLSIAYLEGSAAIVDEVTEKAVDRHPQLGDAAARVAATERYPRLIDLSNLDEKIDRVLVFASKMKIDRSGIVTPKHGLTMSVMEFESPITLATALERLARSCLEGDSSREVPVTVR